MDSAEILENNFVAQILIEELQKFDMSSIDDIHLSNKIEVISPDYLKITLSTTGFDDNNIMMSLSELRNITVHHDLSNGSRRMTGLISNPNFARQISTIQFGIYSIELEKIITLCKNI